MHDVEAVFLAITLPNTSGLPATDLIYDVAWTLNSSQSVSHAVPEGVNDA